MPLLTSRMRTGIMDVAKVSEIRPRRATDVPHPVVVFNDQHGLPCRPITGRALGSMTVLDLVCPPAYPGFIVVPLADLGVNLEVAAGLLQEANEAIDSPGRCPCLRVSC